MFRSDAEVLAGKRRSMFTAGEKLEAEERSPEDTAGADTEAEVVRRQAKLGALGGDVLAEMRYCSLEFESESASIMVFVRMYNFLNFLSI